ncbi:hypothetical protein PITCH_A1390010 [uncultured Desulfobacterium sp.]|uniref:Uncharacterized protein n=1 Tax=uncultured Desulfobacterium sp. TaxID=201089 RepID=A0A445MSV4_9BACT|nr:hypothetical protein PITCH_A1390010 [uncultured Desulfobacterium sp.]
MTEGEKTGVADKKVQRHGTYCGDCRQVGDMNNIGRCHKRKTNPEQEADDQAFFAKRRVKGLDCSILII